MSELRYTLLSDGSSDRALMPILDWLLNENGIPVPQSEWADLSQIPKRRQSSLKSKIEEALNLYPCDLLFVHRDAEREAYEIRKREIMTALEAVTIRPPAICIVPVRMQETWLLFNEAAIRYIVGKPKSRVKLNMPLLKNLEKEPDAKSKLHQALKAAGELQGRDLKKFNVHQVKHRLAEYLKNTDGFAPLRRLTAFQQLEADLQQLIDEQGWHST